MRFPVLCLVLSACAVLPVEAPPDSPRAVEAMQILQDRGFSGSVLVACDERVLFQGDFGLADRAGRTPSYWVASISKQFAAAAVLKLREEGRMSLDDTVARFFPDAPADKAAITISQLLTHFSGLPRQAYAADGIVDRNEAARAIFATTLASPPGSAFAYSNDNYAMVAMVVEIVSGKRYEDFIRDELFAPARLREAGFWPSAADAYVPAVLHPPEGAMAQAHWGFRGADGVRVSVVDLHRWVRALDSGRVLSAESLRQLYGPNARDSDGDGVGFGWFWSDLPNGRWLWTRGTEDFGGNAVIYRLSETSLVIITATNAGPDESVGPGWSRQARDALMDIYGSDACAP